MGRARKPSDPNGKHVRIYCTLLATPAWRCLGWPARALFVDMRASVGATNNGNISAALSDLKHRGWSSSKTLARALYELRALGFIRVTREGGLRQGTRVATLFAFTDLDTFEHPKLGIEAGTATHDYRRFETVAAAEKALSDGVARLREVGRQKQFMKIPPVSLGNRIGSEGKAIRPFIASRGEQGKHSSLPKRNREISA